MSTKTAVIVAIILFFAIICSSLLIAGAIYLGKPEVELPIESPILSAKPGEKLETSTEKTLIIHATGQVEVEPDYIILNVSYGSENYMSAKSAIEDIDQNIQSVIDMFKEKGVLSEDISTYSISTYHGYYGGFSANSSLSVKIRDFDSLPDILDSLVDIPNYTNSWYSYEAEDNTKEYEEALVKALGLAKQRAIQISSEMGVTLGDIIEVNDTGIYDVPQYRYYEMYFNSPSTLVVVSVSITYEIS